MHSSFGFMVLAKDEYEGRRDRTNDVAKVDSNECVKMLCIVKVCVCV